MIFKHGFVHCDPHAANMMIRPMPQDSRKFFGEKYLYLASQTRSLSHYIVFCSPEMKYIECHLKHYNSTIN